MFIYASRSHRKVTYIKDPTPQYFQHEQLNCPQNQRMKYARDPFIWHEGPRLSTIHAVTTAMGDLEQVEEPLSCPTLLQCGQDDQLLNVCNCSSDQKSDMMANCL